MSDAVAGGLWNGAVNPLAYQLPGKRSFISSSVSFRWLCAYVSTGGDPGHGIGPVFPPFSQAGSIRPSTDILREEGTIASIVCDVSYRNDYLGNKGDNKLCGKVLSSKCLSRNSISRVATNGEQVVFEKVSAELAKCSLSNGKPAGIMTTFATAFLFLNLAAMTGVRYCESQWSSSDAN